MGTGRGYDIWVANTGGGTISKIVNDVVVKTISTGGNPYNICMGRDNAIWVTDYASSVVLKIVNDVIVKTISVGSYPYSICVDKNNAVWVTHNTAPGSVTKIVNDTVVKTISVGDSAYGICVDKNNAIWVANLSSCTISKIVNDVVVKTISTGSSSPFDICIDKNNTLWVGTYSSSVYKIVNDVVVKTINIGSRITGICIDKNSAIWVVNFSSGATSKIVNDVVVKTITTPVTTDGSPFDICVDMDNSIWVTIRASLGIVAKIVNDVVVKTINVDGSPQGISSGMELEILFPNKHLIQSGTSIKSFDGTTFTDVGSSPATDTMFENNGFSDFSNLTKDKLSTLTNPKILTKKTDSNNTSLKFTGTPLPKLILAGSDIQLSSSVARVDSFTLTGTQSTNASLRLIVSFDSGATWKTYKNSTWTTVDTSNIANVKNNGLTMAELLAIGGSIWSEVLIGASGSKKLRFGYYLEVTSTSDVVETDALTMQVDMNGAWGVAELNTDYKFQYASDSTASVVLIANGDFRMSVY